MASFRQTTFDPSISQQYNGRQPGAPGVGAPAAPQLNMATMEEQLAREMARMKIDDEKRMREIEKICGQSDELKELQAKIKSAYLNKERASQVTEKQFRSQVEIVSTLKALTHSLIGARCQHRYGYVEKQGDSGLTAKRSCRS